MIVIEAGKDSNKRTYERPNFLTFELGQHRVRLLGNPYKIWTHYIPGKATIRCLGSDCPICQNNKLLKVQNQDAKKLPGYNSPSIRHYFNVLDRTHVKVCPGCQHENKQPLGMADFSPMCSKCGAMIMGITPTVSNKVKVINLSDTNATQLGVIQSSILDADGNPIGLENFDIVFMSIPAGDRKNIFPQADPTVNDKVEIPEEMLYHLDTIVISLDPDEIKSLMSGVALKDIFAARRLETSAEPDINAETLADIDSELGKIFNQ